MLAHQNIVADSAVSGKPVPYRKPFDPKYQSRFIIILVIIRKMIKLLLQLYHWTTKRIIAMPERLMQINWPQNHRPQYRHRRRPAILQKLKSIKNVPNCANSYDRNSMGKFQAISLSLLPPLFYLHFFQPAKTLFPPPLLSTTYIYLLFRKRHPTIVWSQSTFVNNVQKNNFRFSNSIHFIIMYYFI